MSSSGDSGLVKWIGGIVGTVVAGVLVATLTAHQNTEPGTSSPGPAISSARADVQQSTVDFAVTDELGPGQVTERIAVVVSGRSVGTLTVDLVHRSAELTVTVPAAGTYDYELSGSIVVEDEYGTTYQLTGTGRGSVKVASGRRFALMGDYSTNPVRMELQ